MCAEVTKLKVPFYQFCNFSIIIRNPLKMMYKISKHVGVL
jgi:hypothetical protein